MIHLPIQPHTIQPTSTHLPANMQARSVILQDKNTSQLHLGEFANRIGDHTSNAMQSSSLKGADKKDTIRGKQSIS